MSKPLRSTWANYIYPRLQLLEAVEIATALARYRASALRNEHDERRVTAAIEVANKRLCEACDRYVEVDGFDVVPEELESTEEETETEAEHKPAKQGRKPKAEPVTETTLDMWKKE